jgi:peroxiredoxin
MLEVVTLVNNFCLKDSEGHLPSLSEFYCKPVVLYFYPKDDPLGCTKQALVIRELY